MKKTKRILSIIGIAVLVILYVMTLVTAIFDRSAAMQYFKVSVALTILVPVFLYIYTMFYRLSRRDQDEE